MGEFGAVKLDRHSADIAVMGMGLCTPLGLTTLATQVEIVAETVRFVDTDVMDQAGEPIRASLLSLLEPELSRSERLAIMAATALTESLSELSKMGVQRIPVFLGLPEKGSGGPVFLDSLKTALTEAAQPNVQLDFVPHGLCQDGRAGFFLALAAAWRALLSRNVPVVLVGAVDSMCDSVSLTHLAELNRILGSGNMDGLIPGEGAGFSVLARTDWLGNRKLKHQAYILGYALAKESRHFYQREPNLGDGLADVFRQLRKNPIAGSRRVDYLLSCQTGESFWAQEFTNAYLRNASLMPEPLTVDIIAESLGDTGTGSGIILLGVAIYKLRKLCQEYGKPMRVLIYGCSDNGNVGACIVEMRP